MYHVSERDVSGAKPVGVTVSMHGKEVEMRVDTGATCPVMARAVYEEMFGKLKGAGDQVKPCLSGYGGTPLCLSQERWRLRCSMLFLCHLIKVHCICVALLRPSDKMTRSSVESGNYRPVTAASVAATHGACAGPSPATLAPRWNSAAVKVAVR